MSGEQARESVTDGLIDASEIGESIGSALSPSPASAEMVVFFGKENPWICTEL